MNTEWRQKETLLSLEKNRKCSSSENFNTVPARPSDGGPGRVDAAKLIV
jgi:hypothetical protein